MFIQSLKYDYQTAGILVEYVTKSEARQMSSKLIKAIFEKGGELHKFEGFIGGVYTVENYLLVGTDLGADQLDQIIEFIKSAADPDQYDENDYEQKETNRDVCLSLCTIRRLKPFPRKRKMTRTLKRISRSLDLLRSSSRTKDFLSFEKTQLR